MSSSPHTHCLDGYVDMGGNAISDREESVELCAKCHNRIISKAISERMLIRAENDAAIKALGIV